MLVDRLVNNLVKQGADVKQNSIAFSLHSSGHPSRQELRLMQRLVNPRYFMPVHGEYRMLMLHGDIAKDLGMPKENVFICDNGDMLELYDHKVRKTGNRIPAEDVYIDGNDLDGVSGTTISERDVLKNEGMIAVIMTLSKEKGLVVPPIIYPRGFAASESSHVVRHAQMRAEEEVRREMESGEVDYAELKTSLRSVVGKYVERKTGRRPIVLPVVMSLDA